MPAPESPALLNATVAWLSVSVSFAVEKLTNSPPPSTPAVFCPMVLVMICALLMGTVLSRARPPPLPAALLLLMVTKKMLIVVASEKMPRPIGRVETHGRVVHRQGTAVGDVDAAAIARGAVEADGALIDVHAEGRRG